MDHLCPAPDAAQFRSVLSHYPTGVCAITTTDGAGSPLVMIVGSFSAVSLNPPLVGFLPAKTSTTWPGLRQRGHFCVNVLSADQGAQCLQMSSRTGDRFAGLGWRASASGDPILDGVVAWIDCTLHAVSDAGDHDFVLGHVRGMAVESGKAPLIFHRGGLTSAEISK
ncbi:MAG: flavin reductase family protein [Pseudomonadota bacterium]